MAENKGWVKLHRCIMDNWVFDDAKSLKAWLHLILTVNHEENKIPFDGKLQIVKPGQTITSISKLAKAWGYTWRTADKIIKNFILDDMVSIEHIGRAFILTILNYESYQSLSESRAKSRAKSTGESRGESTTDSRDASRGESRGESRQTRRIDTDKNDVKNDTRAKEAAKRKSFDWGSLE